MTKKEAKKRIYLDYASTTPVDPEVLKAMNPFFSNFFHNPSALYREGIATTQVVLEARKSVGKVLSAQSDEIVFTGSGTEADNLAILGVFKAAQKTISKPHIIISAIEHPAILELGAEIERLGGEVTIVPVNEDGLVDPEYIRKSLKPRTVLVSIMYANNEVGAIEPIREIAKVIRQYKKAKSYKLSANTYPYFHTDASQAANYCSLNVLELHTDLLTLDGSKIYGPKGIGMLFVKRGTVIEPIVFGGGQEKGLRSGTESVPLIVGFAKALSIGADIRDKESKRLTKLRNGAIDTILKKFGSATVNGHRTLRIPNNINICFEGIDAEFAVILLDAAGFAVSTASSCRTLSENVRSYVLDAMKGEKCAQSSIRITLGRNTSASDVKALLNVLPKVVASAKTSLLS